MGSMRELVRRSLRAPRASLRREGDSGHDPQVRTLMAIPTGLAHSAQGWTAVLCPPAVLPWVSVPAFSRNPERRCIRPRSASIDGMAKDATLAALLGSSYAGSQGRTAAGLESGGPTLG